MNEAVQGGVRAGRGRLYHDISVHGTDELARTMRALQIMQTKLSGVLSGVKESSLTVFSDGRAPDQRPAPRNLSARTEQQAANLEETASSNGGR